MSECLCADCGIHRRGEVNQLHVLRDELLRSQDREKELRAVLWQIATDPLQDAHIREEVAKVLGSRTEGT